MGLEGGVVIMALLTATSLSWTAILSSPCAPNNKDDAPPEIIGIARDAVSGALLYCEWHGSPDADGNALVRYVTGEGELFAEKRVAYATGLTTPEIEQIDKRSGELHRIERSDRGSGGQSGWLLTYRETADATPQQTRLSDREVDVIDAGFDHRVRAEWARLVAGERVAVQFASTVYQRSLPLRMVQRPARDCELSDEQNLCFWVEPNNFLVRLFVDQLRLSYDPERRLRRFEGVVNIQNAQGEKQSAVIDYAYHPDFEGF